MVEPRIYFDASGCPCTPTGVPLQCNRPKREYYGGRLIKNRLYDLDLLQMSEGMNGNHKLPTFERLYLAYHSFNGVLKLPAKTDEKTL